MASWWSFVDLHRNTQRAPEILEQALIDGLGPDYRDALPPDDYPGEVPLTRREIVIPRLGSRRRYASSRGLSYGDYGRRNVLDIWKRPDLPRDGSAPVLVYIHGSGWMVGSKTGQGYPLLSHMAERGWLCVTINYRLSPAAVWPAHIVDVKRALAWIKRNISDYGGDPQFVAVTGVSAGGHLCALAALTPNVAEFQPGFEGEDTSVVAAVPFYGVYDFTDRDGTHPPHWEQIMGWAVMRSRLEHDYERWNRASPMSWIGPHAPPFFVLHGTHDTLVSEVQARLFASRLRARSPNPAVYAALPGAHHGFDMVRSVRTIHTVRAVDRFLSVVRARAEGAGRSQAPAAGESQATQARWQPSGMRGDPWNYVRPP